MYHEAHQCFEDLTHSQIAKQACSNVLLSTKKSVNVNHLGDKQMINAFDVATEVNNNETPEYDGVDNYEVIFSSATKVRTEHTKRELNSSIKI